jgi:1,4-alpha-glucan branching enzyme
MEHSDLIKKYIPQDDVYLFNTGSARKAWLLYGCHYLPEEETHMFVLWAPNARSVSLVGDFNYWDARTEPMERLEGGVWAAFVPGLKNGSLYKYAVTGADGRTVLKSDPFAAWSETGLDTASRVWDGAYDWRDGAYMDKRAAKDQLASPMSIYEVHLGSWRDYSDSGKPAYRAAGDELAKYCRDMGYTHVELLPVTEYPYPASWGYQVTGYYAPTSRYGSPEDFMYFVDRLHRAGIGVIIDWVPAHFPKDEHGLAKFDGTNLFECKEQRMAEHPDWGTLIFDYAMPEVRSFLISSACLFFDRYHVDGIRADAVSSMLYLDYGRRSGEWTPNRQGGNINLDAVEFLQKLNEAVLTGYPGAVTIAEESTAYPMVTYPPADGGLGFTFKWDMGFMHDTLDYMAADPYFRSGCHDKLTFSMMYAFSENFILAYSHDEVVHGKGSMVNKMFGGYDQKFASLRTLYGYQYAHPGKKLTFMGSEFAQFIEWDFQKPLDWMLLDYPKHKGMQSYVQELNRLYKSWPALYEIDKSWDGFTWLNVDDRQRSAVAFLRTARSGGKKKYLVCACNFTPVACEDFVIGLPFPGKLAEIFSSDEERFGGSGFRNGEIRSADEPFIGMAQSARITIPGMSTVYFSFEPSRTGRGSERTGHKK